MMGLEVGMQMDKKMSQCYERESMIGGHSERRMPRSIWGNCREVAKSLDHKLAIRSLKILPPVTNRR